MPKQHQGTGTEKSPSKGDLQDAQTAALAEKHRNEAVAVIGSSACYLLWSWLYFMKLPLQYRTYSSERVLSSVFSHLNPRFSFSPDTQFKIHMPPPLLLRRQVFPKVDLQNKLNVYIMYSKDLKTKTLNCIFFQLEMPVVKYHREFPLLSFNSKESLV